MAKLQQILFGIKYRQSRLLTSLVSMYHWTTSREKLLSLTFFFSRCPIVCPGLARNMKKLQDSFRSNDSIVQFVSVSIDPEYDSVPRLRKFADKFNVNHDTWWFRNRG